MMRFKYLPLLFLIGIGLDATAKIYTWKDSSGKVHYSDKPAPDQTSSEVELKVASSDWKPYDIEIVAVGFELEADDKERILKDVNAVYYFYHQRLFLSSYETVPVNIKIYATKKQYQLGLKGHGVGSSRGVFIPKENQIALYLRKDKEGTFGTIKHETSHAIAHTSMPYLPSWLNEGLAENMETVAKRGSEVVIGPHQENYRNLQRLKKKNRLMSLKKMLQLPSHRWRSHNRTGAGLQTQTGELVRMLFSSHSGRTFVNKLIREYKHGDRTFAFYHVSDSYFGGMKILNDNWKKWLNRSASQVIRF